MHLQHAIVETNLHLRFVFNVLELDRAQAVAHSFFAHVVNTDSAQSHIQSVTGNVIKKVQAFGVVSQTVPINFVGNRFAANLFDLLDAFRQCCLLQFLNLTSFLYAHSMSPSPSVRTPLACLYFSEMSTPEAC